MSNLRKTFLPPMAAIFSSQAAGATSLSAYPFCSKAFRRVGNHLPHCKGRNGADYSCYLSQTTLNKRGGSSLRKCPKCNRLFKRLDTHLHHSAVCKTIPCPSVASPVPTPSSESCGASTMLEPTSSPGPQSKYSKLPPLLAQLLAALQPRAQLKKLSHASSTGAL